MILTVANHIRHRSEPNGYLILSRGQDEKRKHVNIKQFLGRSVPLFLKGL